MDNLCNPFQVCLLGHSRLSYQWLEHKFGSYNLLLLCLAIIWL